MIQMHQAFRRGWRHDRGVMNRHSNEPASETLGARWTHATNLLGREARLFREGETTSLERRRAVRRIQVLERIARRAMNDYRVALQRELESGSATRIVH